jgi:hypothetical protein
MNRLALLGLFCVGLLAPAARGADAPSLVRQLGAESFAARESAFKDLLGMGRAAEAALRAGLMDPDPEVRRGCEALLPLALRSDLEIRLDAFVQDGDDKAPPALPGWARFRELAGDDFSARRLFADLCRADRPLLEALGKDPAQVAAQLADRRNRLQQRAFTVKRGDPAEVEIGEAAGLLLAAACAAPQMDLQAFYQINSLFYQPGVRSVVAGNPAAARLLVPVLSRRMGDPGGAYQVVYLARSLGMTEFLKKTVEPEARKQIAAARENPADANRLYQAVNLAVQLELDDTLVLELRPTVRKLAADAAQNPGDLGKFYQALNVARQLNMQDVLDETLRPAVTRMLTQAAENPNDFNRIHQALYPAQNLGMQDAIDALLKPAVHKQVVAATRGPFDPNRFNQALNLARQLNMQETTETVLKPYARERVIAVVEESDDLGRLTEAAQLARNVGLQDVLNETLRPVVARATSEALKGSPDLTRITQAHGLMLTLAMRDDIDKTLKPAFRKALSSAESQPFNAATFSQTLNLARGMALKEAVPYALKGAEAKQLDPHSRGMGLLYVAQHGGKEHIARLEPLLADTTSLGQAGINGTTLNTQMRDVALAAMIALSGQKLGDYGYPYFQLVPGLDLSSASAVLAGLPSDTARETALKKYKEWAAAQKK